MVWSQSLAWCDQAFVFAAINQFNMSLKIQGYWIAGQTSNLRQNFITRLLNTGCTLNVAPEFEVNRKWIAIEHPFIKLCSFKYTRLLNTVELWKLRNFEIFIEDCNKTKILNSLVCL